MMGDRWAERADVWLGVELRMDARPRAGLRVSPAVRLSVCG
jgi:hypothetical protein